VEAIKTKHSKKLEEFLFSSFQCLCNGVECLFKTTSAACGHRGEAQVAHTYFGLHEDQNNLEPITCEVVDTNNDPLS
jgi:hypothetical protein